MNEDDIQHFSTMASAAIQVHELYTSYVDAGFTDEQAIRLVIAMIQAPGGNE